MSENSAKVSKLTEILHREEKKFLMEQYTSLLVQQLEKDTDEELDERTIESLLVCRSYVDTELTNRIASILEAHGHSVDWKDEEGEAQDPLDEGMTEVDVEEAEDEEDDEGIFEDSDEEQDEDGDLFEEAEDEEGLADIENEEGVEGLFEENDEEQDEDGDLSEEEEDEEGIANIEEAEDEEGVEGLFEESDEEQEGDGDLSGEAEDEEGIEDIEDEQDEEGDEGLFEENDEEQEEDGVSESEEEQEEDEEAGVLFSQDIYSGHKGSQRRHPDDEPEPLEASDGEKETSKQIAARKETPGFIPPERQEKEETPGFIPTRGHEIEETPGFIPPEQKEAEETPGFIPPERQEKEETPGFIPPKQKEAEETPGFIPPERQEKEETPGFTPTEQKEKRLQKKRKMELEARQTDDQQKKKRRERKRSEAQDGRQTAIERAAKAREEIERRKKAREAQRRARERETEAPPGKDVGELVDAITHTVSIRDLERCLGVQVAPEDRLNLERRLDQKLREPCVQSLLGQMKELPQSYALIPRLPHFFKNGSRTRITVVELLRNHPQLFENVQQIILKYRAEAFFTQQTPKLDWAIVTCEALSESKDRNYAQQRQVIRQYVMPFQTSERRVGRRYLVEALYDLIVTQFVLKETMLQKTADLTESQVGRLNLAFINYGDNGIRINDISRRETHPQLGVCPSW